MAERKFLIQLQNNEVGIISLILAIIALFLSLWLYEKSESNRNIRTASFEVLIHLGELQQVVNAIHYEKEASAEAIRRGWGHIALIGDLSTLIPSPIPEASQRLIEAWKENLDALKDSEENASQLSENIDTLRKEVVKILAHLS